MLIDCRALKDTPSELVVFTGGQHTWVLGRPNKKG